MPGALTSLHFQVALAMRGESWLCDIRDDPEMKCRVLRWEITKEMNLSWTRMPTAAVTEIKVRSGRYAIGYQSAKPTFPDWAKIKDVTSKASGRLSDYSR